MKKLSFKDMKENALKRDQMRMISGGCDDCGAYTKECGEECGGDAGGCDGYCDYCRNGKCDC